MKVSYPKLHSIKWKDGIHGPNIAILQSRVRENIPAHDVLMGACLYNLKDVVVFGYDQDGNEEIFGSVPSSKEAHYMFSRGAFLLLDR